MRACTSCAKPIEQGRGTRCPACSKAKGSSWSANRNGRLHKRFARKVLARDKRCQLCGATRELVAHHTRSLSAPDAYSPSAGVTLCRDCHRRVDPHAR